MDEIWSAFENSLWPAEESIQTIYRSVNEAYAKILSRIPCEQFDIVSKIFRIIIAARRPLTITEMAIALGLALRLQARTIAEAWIDPHHLSNKLRTLCGLFVFVNNFKIYLIHQTAKDYLTEGVLPSHPLSAYYCSWENPEDQMGRICLQYVSMKDLGENHVQETSSSTSLLQYSATCWYSHVKNMTSATRQKVSDLLYHSYDTTTHQFRFWFHIFWGKWGSKEQSVELIFFHLADLVGDHRMVHHLLD